MEAVVHTGYWFMELEPWGRSPLEGSFGEDLVELEAIIAETQGILFELKVIQDQFTRVFSLDSAPDSTAALQERMWEIRRIRAEAYQRGARYSDPPWAHYQRDWAHGGASPVALWRYWARNKAGNNCKP